MAVVTLLGTATFNTTAGSKTVTATPAVGDLIIIITAHSGNTSTSATPPTDNQSGTYTLITSALKNASADVLCAWVRTARVSSAVSTIYTHNPGTTTGGGLAVLKVTGMNTAGASAVRQSNAQANAAASGTPTVALGSAMLTTNCGIGAVFNGTNPATLTPRGAPWGEDADLGYNTPASGLEVMSCDSGETASSIAWGGTSGTAFGAVVFELNVPPNHAATGVLQGRGGSIAVSGSAARATSHVTHTDTGVLQGAGASTSGAALKSNVTLSGTITASVTETDIAGGGKVITLTLSGDTWIA